MNFLSIYIRGVRDSNKARWIKDLKINHKLNFLVTDLDIRKVSSIWGRGPIDFDLVNHTGGSLNTWDPSLFTKMSSTSSIIC